MKLDLGDGWRSAAEVLVRRGWVRLSGVLTSDLIHALATAPRPPWRALPRQEGVVVQHGFGAYLPLEAADPAVVTLATEIIASLQEGAAAFTTVALPNFNEVTWTKYPVGSGHITAHRDPFAYGGVIATMTLKGEANFIVWDEDGCQHTWPTAAGDIVLLLGRGWPERESLCPKHEVEPPRQSERVIMTLRSNRGGAGAGYDV